MSRYSIRNEMYRVVFWQFALTMGLALVLFLLQGLQSGLSALLGSLAYCVPNIVFVWRVFSKTSAQLAKQFLITFFVGETAKLFLSAIFFVLIVKYLPVKVVPTLGGFIAAIVAFWIVGFMSLSRQRQGDQS